MICSFFDVGAEDLFNGRDTKNARKTLPTNLNGIVARKFLVLNGAASLQDLRVPPGNRLEALHGDREGQHSIRINDKYRICFNWTSNGPANVEVTDYH